MKVEGFGRRLRLRRRREFLFVQRRGHKHHTRHFLVFVAPQDPVFDHARSVTNNSPDTSLRPSRLGVTVTRKVGGAVVRNRIKRLVREAYRTNRSWFCPGLDMVWIAKRSAAGASYADVVSDMNAMGRRLRRAEPTAVKGAAR